MTGHGYSDRAVERFWSHVDASGDCWIWLGADNGRGGYGKFGPSGRRIVYVHRMSYELTIDAPIPAGLLIDHRCRNRRCVNPAHLEAVTNRENLMRAFIGDRNREHIARRTRARRAARLEGAA